MKTNSNINEQVNNTASVNQDRDYRDELREILDSLNKQNNITRYRITKRMGIDSGTLSNVLAKRRHFSLDRLVQILDLAGYKMVFEKTEKGVDKKLMDTASLL